MENFNVKFIVLGILYIIAVLFTVLDFIYKYKKAEDSTDKYKYIFLIFVIPIFIDIHISFFNIICYCFVALSPSTL